jgi:hypothetical protein
MRYADAGRSLAPFLTIGSMWHENERSTECCGTVSRFPYRLPRKLRQSALAETLRGFSEPLHPWQSRSKGAQ